MTESTNDTNRWSQPTFASVKGVDPGKIEMCPCGREVPAGTLIDIRSLTDPQRPAHRAEFACVACIRHAQLLGLHYPDELLRQQGAPTDIVAKMVPVSNYLRQHHTAAFGVASALAPAHLAWS
jgi:hypothetical protein